MNESGMNIALLSTLALYLLVHMRTMKIMGTQQLGHGGVVITTIMQIMAS